MLLIGIDTETTTAKPETAELLQVGMVAHYTARGSTHVVFNSKCQPKSGEIPQEASEIHGIYMQELKYQPLDSYIAYQVGLLLDDADEGHVIVTYNGEGFDIPILEKYGVEIEAPHIDVFRIVQRELFSHGLKLSEVHRSYIGEELDDAHDAIPDILATIKILTTYLERTGKTISQVIKELSSPVELTTCYFGKHRGQAFRSLPRGYIRWLRDNFANPSVDLDYTINAILGAK